MLKMAAPLTPAQYALLQKARPAIEQQRQAQRESQRSQSLLEKYAARNPIAASKGKVLAPLYRAKAGFQEVSRKAGETAEIGRPVFNIARSVLGSGQRQAQQENGEATYANQGQPYELSFREKVQRDMDRNKPRAYGDESFNYKATVERERMKFKREFDKKVYGYKRPSFLGGFSIGVKKPRNEKVGSKGKRGGRRESSFFKGLF